PGSGQRRQSSRSVRQTPAPVPLARRAEPGRLRLGNAALADEQSWHIPDSGLQEQL
ncbi:unnamed protein product, partial [Lampetra planeri]